MKYYDINIPICCLNCLFWFVTSTCFHESHLTNPNVWTPGPTGCLKVKSTLVGSPLCTCWVIRRRSWPFPELAGRDGQSSFASAKLYWEYGCLRYTLSHWNSSPGNSIPTTKKMPKIVSKTVVRCCFPHLQVSVTFRYLVWGCYAPQKVPGPRFWAWDRV